MSSLTQLLQNPQLWHGNRRNENAGQNSLSTGYRALDEALHGRGWPLAGSTELLCERTGIGELSLLLPGLAQLGQQQRIAWLNPPFQPYAPALAQAGLAPEHCLFIQTCKPRDTLWAAEQLLRASAFAAVIHWSGQTSLADRDLRRLQLASREQACWHIHLRALAVARQSSPAPLRLCLSGSADELNIELLKQAGGPAGQHLRLRRDERLLYKQQAVAQWAVTGPSRRPARLRLARPSPPAIRPAETARH